VIATQDQVYIARQPILDRQLKIMGYELLFRHSAEAGSANVVDDFHAGTNVLINTLCHVGTEWLLGDKLAFINVSNPMLESDLLELLPAKRVVLEILRETEITPPLFERMETMRGRGFRFALEFDANRPDIGKLMGFVDFIKIDLRMVGLDKVAAFAPKLADKYPDKLVAEKVETKADFAKCKDLGFKYFQGYHFAKPETFATKVINPAHAIVVDLLNKVRNNADVREIEAAFKRDVALSFKLLRYINSVGFGLSCQIQSIRHALTILGYQQLYRWLTLLLVTAGDGATPPALMKTAVTRGRLTELLGEGYFDKAQRDNLFVVGVFSLLDAMLDMKMEDVLDKLNLPEDVNEALQTRGGIYGPFLELAIACEDADPELIGMLAENLTMEAEKVSKAHMEALAWAETLGI
jgi:EAL and modified HD-GYP domain-containing signal transduction protein